MMTSINNSKRIKRKQRLQDLMKDRTTIDQGLTLRQIFKEVYQDVITKYPNEYDLEEDYQGRYQKYLRRIIRKITRTDIDFKRLLCIPCKDERGKIKQYVWVRLIDSSYNHPYDCELINEACDFWDRKLKAQIQSYERKRKKLEHLAQMSEEEYNKDIELTRASFEYERRVYYNCCDDQTIDRIIGELRSEGRLNKLPIKYRPNYIRITKAVTNELLNKQIMRHRGWLNNEGKLPEHSEVRQSLKDVIATYCNRRYFSSSLENIDID